MRSWRETLGFQKPDDAVRCYFHRGTVNSQTVIDQLRMEFDADEMTQQMLMADENALKNYARN